MTTTDPQLLEILKLAAWQQAVIGTQAAWSIREALRLDDTPPPPVPRDDVFLRVGHKASTNIEKSEAQAARDLVRKPSMDRRLHGVWAGTQLLLSAAANVSKLLWPPPGDSELHCEDLRRLLGVGESWSLRDRWLRNSFEHFGQRIVDWASEHAGEPFSDSTIMRLAETARTKPDYALPIRAFVEDAFSVIFMGRHIELKPLETELEAIRGRASPSAGLYLED
ncbi:MAG: hypothetical protein M3O70_16425 [Actinomycetota bacterium]|nr:hypothetical protein [Actinomycetota bacterium]